MYLPLLIGISGHQVHGIDSRISGLRLLAAPAAVCRWGLCLRCLGVGRSLSGVYISSSIPYPILGSPELEPYLLWVDPGLTLNSCGVNPSPNPNPNPQVNGIDSRISGLRLLAAPVRVNPGLTRASKYNNIL